MKKILYIITLLMSTLAFSQVGIGTQSPSGKSILDLTATDKGLLLPRMNTLQRQGISPTATVDKGLTVFDTDSNSIWFWNGTTWINTLNATNVADTSWSLHGNSGTTPPTNYIGTSDAKDLLLKSNNAELIRLSSSGNIGVNTATPDTNSLMDFNGTTVGNKGVKLPYMTTATRNALGLSSVLAGTTMYNTTTECMEVFINSNRGWYNPCTNTFSNVQPASISSFNCGGITKTGNYYTGASVNGLGYTITIPYTGGNGGVFSTQTIYSTGVTGLIASLNGGTLVSGPGNLVLSMSGTPSAAGTATFNINIFGQTCTTTITVDSGGTISGTLTAGSPTFASVLNSPSTTQAFAGYPVSGGSANLTYTSPANGPYNGASFTSSGVLGLTASITSGTLNSGGGSIPVTISGIPDKVGNASFSIIVSGKSTTLIVPVTAFVSCADYKAKNAAAGFSGFADGVYKIDPDLAGTVTNLINCQCDMTTDGGGWTLVLNYLHAATTNPNISAKTNTLPILGSTTLGTDESASTTTWGHTTPSLFSLLSPTEVRFYGKSSIVSRVTHFKTTHASLISYFKTGSGSCTGLNTDFTPMVGHTSVMPGDPNTQYAVGTNQGNNAMTEFPFYNPGIFHWCVKGYGAWWDVDTTTGGAIPSTYHQIWAR